MFCCDLEYPLGQEVCPFSCGGVRIYWIVTIILTPKSPQSGSSEHSLPVSSAIYGSGDHTTYSELLLLPDLVRVVDGEVLMEVGKA